MTITKIGRIYRIINTQSDICYIGSTFNSTRDRFRAHKNSYQEWLNNKHGEIAIYPYFKEYGVEKFKIVLVKEYEVVDRLHLKTYESLWINKFRKTCVNKNNPFRIKKLSDKHRNEKNKEKKYEWYENNKAKYSKKITCECGSTHRHGSKARHHRTMKHQEWLSKQ
jgi:hypothetical protein